MSDLGIGEDVQIDDIINSDDDSDNIMANGGDNVSIVSVGNNNLNTKILSFSSNKKIIVICTIIFLVVAYIIYKLVTPKIDEAPAFDYYGLPNVDNILELFTFSCLKYNKKIALIDSGNKLAYTYFDYYYNVIYASNAFMALGLKYGETVAILGTNHPHWFIAYFAALFSGAVPVGIYPTSTPAACQYIIDNCKCKLLIAEDMDQLNKIKNRPPTCILYNDTKSDSMNGLYAWKKVIQTGRKFDHPVIPSKDYSHEVVTMIYTSGTTGDPKGAQITHKNIITVLKSVLQRLPFTIDEKTVSYLPLNHIAAQLLDIYIPLCIGGTVYTADKDAMKGSLLKTLKEVRPTFFAGVPRVWEKIQEEIMKKFGMFAFLRYLKPIQYMIRYNLGLDKCRYCVTTAAPISLNTLKWFESTGITLYEIYGMTETTGPVTISTPKEYKLGSVGKPLPGVEVMISQSDEIMVRGDSVFKGYIFDYQKPIWLNTGDLGKFDSDGFLYITGRSKELIITAGGENIPPLEIEQRIKENMPFVENAVVLGDKQKYLVALLTVKPESVYMPEAIVDGMNVVNKNVASTAQTIKKWYVLPDRFSVQSGEMTPTMKLKRPYIEQKFRPIIDGLYEIPGKW